MVDSIHRAIDMDILCDVGFDKSEIRILIEMVEVFQCACNQTVDTDDFMPFSEQTINEM
jgi:hypothetical protein